MLDIYTTIVLITFFILIITAVDVIVNKLVSKKQQLTIIFLCIFIGLAIGCEWIGVKTNGASAYLINLHKGSKLLEFIVSPIISYGAAYAYGKVKNLKFIFGMSVANAIFEIVAFVNEWVFSVDEQNFYHREGLYWIYVVVFVLSIIYCFVCIFRANKKYPARFGGVLILILCFLAMGIGIQMIDSELRIDFMCVAIGNILLYTYFGNVVHQSDATTRLLNRSCYERKIENLKSSAYVLIFDINKFKEINDTYGHSQGDRCLMFVAQQIYSVYGKYGFCYRIGGDEFCVIMHKCLNKLEELNNKFQNALKYSCENNIELSGVALGYAFYDVKKNDIQAVIKEADENMYQSKFRDDK